MCCSLLQSVALNNCTYIAGTTGPNGSTCSQFATCTNKVASGGLLSVTHARQIPTHHCKARPRLSASLSQVTIGLMAATAQRALWANTKHIRDIQLLAVTTASRASSFTPVAMVLRQTVSHVQSILATALQRAQINPNARATSWARWRTIHDLQREEL